MNQTYRWTETAKVHCLGVIIIITTALLSGCMSWFGPLRENPQTVIQGKRELNKDDLHLGLFTPQASPYLASIKRVYGNKLNHLDRAHHLAMLRLFYEDLKYAELPSPRNLNLFQRLLNLDVEKDSAEINRIYDEAFLKFSTAVGVSNFREEIKGRVANAINIRHDFHEISPMVPFGVGELAYHCIMMGGSIDVESFHPGLNESTAIDSAKGLHDKFDNRLGPRGMLDGNNLRNSNPVLSNMSPTGDIDPEFIDGSSIVLYFKRTDLRIRYFKDRFTGQYRAGSVLNGPYDLEWLAHRAGMACLTGVRPMDLVFASSDTHKALMENANGIVNIVEPEPLLEDVHLRQFIFPSPCELDSTKDFSQIPWDCFDCGVDIYGKLQKILSNDSLKYTVNLVVTDLKDTIYSRSLNRRFHLAGQEEGPGFHTRYFGGNFHRISSAKKRESVYSIGWSFQEEESGKVARLNQAFTLPNVHDSVPHFAAYPVNGQVTPAPIGRSRMYDRIPIFSLPRKWDDSLCLWFPAMGLTRNDTDGGYKALANLFLVKKGSLKEGRARIIMESLRFSYDADSLIAMLSPDELAVASLKQGYMGSMELNSKGPNGYFTMTCSVDNLKRGGYDAFIFVVDYDPNRESFRLISTALAENLMVK